MARREPERVIAIGDMHGCRDHLLRLLDRLAPTNRDELVFLGDYVGLGPDVPGLLDELLDLATDIPCVFLRGDLDELFLLGREGPPVSRWTFLWSGGRSTLAAYGGWDAVPPEHWAFLERTELGYRRDGHLFVHAGLRPGVSVRKQRREDILWGVDSFWLGAGRWDEVIVCGHRVQRRPWVTPTRVALDTGAALGTHGVLSAYEVRTRQVWCVGLDDVVRVMARQGQPPSGRRVA